jgi:hypothetical protein
LHPHTNSEIPLRDSSVTVKSERAYHDLPGFRSDAKDVLQQLQANIALLEDKCGRLNFMMGEVRSVIRK